MTTPNKEIKAIVKSLDINNDDQWAEDNSPNLSIVQKMANDDTITAEQVSNATEGFRRPAKTPPPEAKAQEPAVTGVVPSLDADVGSPEFAKAKLLAAREASAEISQAIKDAEGRRDAASSEIDLLKSKNDSHILDIEKFGPRVAQAEAVKAIQRQTQNRLSEQKASAIAVSQVMRQTGAMIHPSRLDAALAMRKRTQEQNRNYAAFVHQNANRQVAERG